MVTIVLCLSFHATEFFREFFFREDSYTSICSFAEELHRYNFISVYDRVQISCDLSAVCTIKKGKRDKRVIDTNPNNTFLTIKRSPENVYYCSSLVLIYISEYRRVHSSRKKLHAGKLPAHTSHTRSIAIE